jgi:hypothetical protein
VLPGPCGGAPRESIYRESARRAAFALARAGDAGEELFESHLANTLIHTWDLAQATGLDFDLPNPHTIDIALRYLHRLPPESRGQDKPFAAIGDFPAAAPMDEVLFLSGRQPGVFSRVETPARVTYTPSSSAASRAPGSSGHDHFLSG